MSQSCGTKDRKFLTFCNLILKAIKPAVHEINALASFSIDVKPLKSGRKVTGFIVSWRQKDGDELKAAVAEVRQPRAGRKARIEGGVEDVVRYELLDFEKKDF